MQVVHQPARTKSFGESTAAILRLVPQYAVRPTKVESSVAPTDESNLPRQVLSSNTIVVLVLASREHKTLPVCRLRSEPVLRCGKRGYRLDARLKCSRR